MPKRTDASLSVSDIGVDSILDAAGLGDDYDSMLDAGPAPVTELGSDLGFGPDPEFADSTRDVMDEEDFALALDANAPLIPDAPVDEDGLSGIDSGFFDPAVGAEMWEVPSDRGTRLAPTGNPNVLGQFGEPRRGSEQTKVIGGRVSRAPTSRPNPASPVNETVFRADPRLSQLPHFELDLPQDTTDPADQTVIASQDLKTGVPDARVGIVKKRRSQRGPSPEDFVGESSSTQRPVLIRPDDNLARVAPIDAAKNSGQVLARARVVSKVVRRRNSNGTKKSAAERSIPDRIPLPIEFVEAADTIVIPDEQAALTTPRRDSTPPPNERPTLSLDEGEDGTPDEVRIERPTGAAALVAWMNDDE